VQREVEAQKLGGLSKKKMLFWDCQEVGDSNGKLAEVSALPEGDSSPNNTLSRSTLTQLGEKGHTGRKIKLRGARDEEILTAPLHEE